MALLALASLFACDPGIKIHQVNSSTSTSQTPNSPVTVKVSTEDQFIGETWYAPHASITNSSDSEIIVQRVELITTNNKYPNKPFHQKYPLRVPPGGMEPLETYFTLNEPVYKTFKQPAELRVHYRSKDRDQVAVATIGGGKLSGE